MPPREKTGRGAAATAGAGAATAATAGPALAAPSAGGLAALGVAGAITAASAAAIVKRIIDGLDAFMDVRLEEGLLFLAGAVRDSYPDLPKRDMEQVVSREREFEQTFRRKMRDRLKTDLPKALAISDPAARQEALRKILAREQRYTLQREEAMLTRAISRIEMNQLMQVSPEGAYWKLSPLVKEHTLDCLAMGEKFWPWAVLREMHPPLHAGCPCSLWGKDEAIDAGLMTADQVPDPVDAARRFRKLVRQVKELEDALGIEECAAAVEEILSAGMVLEEARSKGHTSAMVALYPTPSVAKRLALKDGKAERVDDLHVTLAFLGKAADLKDHDRLREIVQGVAASFPKLSGEVSGIGLFTAGPEPVTYASIDVPGLEQFRERLVAALRTGGYPPKTEHGFTPHMTLAYEDRKDVNVPNAKLAFSHVAVVLADKHTSFPLGGHHLEEARRGHRDPLRWAKGFVKGGKFRPQRGGVSDKVRKALDTPESPASASRRGVHAHRWVRGTYTRIPVADRWERRFGSAHYVSPPGSSDVYRNGVPIDPSAERKRPVSVSAPQVDPQLADRVRVKRHERRELAVEKARQSILQARANRPPVSEGDGPEALLALPHAGFQIRRGAPASHGTVIEYEYPGGAELTVGWDGKQITAVDWQPTPQPREVRASLDRPPRTFAEFQRDALAWADELGMRFNAEVDLPEVRAEGSLSDHAGRHLWTGEALIGREVPKDIQRAAQAREDGRPLTDDEMRGVYGSYWVTGHEISHAVNPPDPFLFTGPYATLDEVLAEEAGHLLAVERLTEQGQDDVLDWRRRHPEALEVQGNYQAGRNALALLFDQAELRDPLDRREFLLELAFETPTEKRFERIAEKLKERRPDLGVDLRTLTAHAEGFLTDPEITDSYRPVLTFDRSPGKKQVGDAQYGRFVDAVLSPDATSLEMPTGHRRRVEKLPVVVPEALGITDGWAVTSYRPGEEFTDGLTYKDGTPKNFRYVDSEARGKLILRAFAGKGSPGTMPQLDPADVARAAEEIRAAKGLIEIEGVPVKRRFDGSFGIGWYQDGRNLSGVSGEEAAARVALTRAQIDPPWALADSAWGRAPASPGTEDSGMLGKKLQQFMEAINPKHKPGEWLGGMGGETPKFDKPKKKAKPPKKEFIGGKKGAKPAEGPIPSYDMVRLELGKSAGGSNGARWAFDKNGARWLVKTYRGNEDRIATELLANQIYREMGAKVAEAGQIDVKGKPALTYPTLEGEVKHHVFSKEGPSEEVGAHFMVDALLANWDYVGMSDDNIMWDPDGKPFRVDQGGTFEFRAQGQEKPFGPIPTEVWTMRTKGQAKRGAKVTEDQMRDQAADIVKRLKPAEVDRLVDAAPFGDEEMRDRIRENLKARIEWMDGFAKGEIELPKPLEGDEARGFLHRKDRKFKVYPEEEAAVRAFMEGEDEEINGFLRSGAKREQAPKSVQSAVKTLDGLLDAVDKTDDDVIGWVGLDLGEAGDPAEFGKDLVGKSFEEKGYLKASLDADQAKRFASAVRLVIPAGTRTLYTPGLRDDDLPAEPELLFGRGAKLRISGRRIEDGKVVFDATVSLPSWKSSWQPPKPKKPKPPKKIEPPEKEEPKTSSFWDDIADPMSS